MSRSAAISRSLAGPTAYSAAPGQGMALPALVGDLYANFANDNNGVPGTAESGQTFLRSVTGTGIVQATISSGALVAADSGQSTTAAYTSLYCKEEIKQMYADIMFGDTSDNLTLIACGGYSAVSNGPGGAEILHSSVHIGFSATGWFIQYGSGGSLTTVTTGSATVPLNTRVRVGWRISGNDVYLRLANGSEVGPYTSAALVARTNHVAVFEHFRNATGTPLLKIFAVSTNLFATPLAAGRTNLLTQPNNLSNSAWTKAQVTITAGQADTDGGTLADKMLETAVTNSHYVYTAPAKAASALRFTSRAKGKPVNGRWMVLACYGTTYAAGLKVYFDITTGALGTAGGAFTFPSWSIYSLGNGWYEAMIEGVTDTTATLETYYQAASADNTDNYAGDVTKGVTIFDEWAYARAA